LSGVKLDFELSELDRPLAVVVREAVVFLAASVITSVISVVTALVVTAITFVVVMPVIDVDATIVIASVSAALVAEIIMSTPVVVAMIGPAVAVITSIRSTVTVVEMLIGVLVVVVAALGLLGVGGYSNCTLQLLALPHGMFGVIVELALLVHDHVEVSFQEGGGSGWICHVSFTRSFARPISSIAMIFSVEVVHHRVLSVD
jgi:hypothetical protein